MGAERSARYWKARAEALDAANRRLHARLEALAALLPPEYLDLLEAENPSRGRPRLQPASPDAGGDEGFLTPSEVATEIRSLWERTAPPRDG